mmetsp:Transcript_17177/g.41188  ORF Transcript_17177/g.41188 Transcript_17177/m.41188 type:complete len:250 (-) Transcript_17177:510-1259(-)
MQNLAGPVSSFTPKRASFSSPSSIASSSSSEVFEEDSMSPFSVVPPSVSHSGSFFVRPSLSSSCRASFQRRRMMSARPGDASSWSRRPRPSRAAMSRLLLIDIRSVLSAGSANPMILASETVTALGPLPSIASPTAPRYTFLWLGSVEGMGLLPTSLDSSFPVSDSSSSAAADGASFPERRAATTLSRSVEYTVANTDPDDFRRRFLSSSAAAATSSAPFDVSIVPLAPYSYQSLSASPILSPLRLNIL